MPDQNGINKHFSALRWPFGEMRDRSADGSAERKGSEPKMTPDCQVFQHLKWHPSGKFQFAWMPSASAPKSDTSMPWASVPTLRAWFWHSHHVNTIASDGPGAPKHTEQSQAMSKSIQAFMDLCMYWLFACSKKWTWASRVQATIVNLFVSLFQCVCQFVCLFVYLFAVCFVDCLFVMLRSCVYCLIVCCCGCLLACLFVGWFVLVVCFLV
jgi:hypothetical protein